MDAIEGGAIVLLLIALYAGAVWALRRSGRIGKDRALSFFGPALMLKTRRGQSFLDRLGRYRRFWSVAGDIGIALAISAMALIVGLLVLGAFYVRQVPASAAPSPQEALGLPGINPIIPLGYGLVALIVGVVLHELCHGVVARSQGIGVKSIGILWLVIPVGAFVEQDDADMQAAPRRRRDRVAAAGVLANFGLTVVFFVLLAALLSTSVTPVADGLGISSVVSGMPASNASLAAGDVLTSLNGTMTPNVGALEDALSTTHPGENVTITYYSTSLDRSVTSTLTLTSLTALDGVKADRNRSALGVVLTPLTPAQLRTELVSPVSASGGPLIGVTTWIILPLATLEPVSSQTAVFFHLSGPMASLGSGGFWIVANLLYWLAWMNLLLGLSNALPLVPLDGGLLFRDFMATLGARLRRGWNASQLEQFASRAAIASSLIIVLLLVWQFVGPQL
ncbi:MAG: site-2 protease family protein [Thermoplasmata archaeon]|nr:site-2 protease family protein [Thermoplasmata archaeon]